jgi:hypothetical protein
MRLGPIVCRLVLALSLVAGLTSCQNRLTGADDSTTESSSSSDGESSSGSDDESSSDSEIEPDASSSTSSSDSDTADTEADRRIPEAPTLQLSLSRVKQFNLSWTPALGAQYYQVLESVNEGEPHAQVGDDVLGLAMSLTVPLYRRVNASYVVRACNDFACTDSAAVDVEGSLVEAVGYFKASNTGADQFGWSVALSGDGETLAVGAWTENSSATGIDGDQADSSLHAAGAVYVFVRTARGEWSQQAYVKASNTDAGDYFGSSVALSADGDTLAVGASSESSNATGIDGDESNNSSGGAGAVYVFVRDGQGDWAQQAYVKASDTADGDDFGSSVALSADGNTLAVGACSEDSMATGIDNQAADFVNEGEGVAAGAVYVFVRDEQGAWSQQAYVKASNTGPDDLFGWSVAFSGDGNTLAVGAVGEGGSSIGAGYVFARDNQGQWSQQAYIKSSNPSNYDRFGWSVALSGDGNTLAIGGKPVAVGEVFVYERDDQGEWSQQALLTSGDDSDYFGVQVALSAHGHTLVVGAPGDDSSAVGLDGNQAEDSSHEAGAAHVFVRNEQGEWSQQAYVKASNTDPGDRFGWSMALSDDGSTLAVGAPDEDSNATGIGGRQTNYAAWDAGAVYVY